MLASTCVREVPQMHGSQVGGVLHTMMFFFLVKGTRALGNFKDI
jgi:hypothetical protein